VLWAGGRLERGVIVDDFDAYGVRLYRIPDPR